MSLSNFKSARLLPAAAALMLGACAGQGELTELSSGLASPGETASVSTPKPEADPRAANLTPEVASAITDARRLRDAGQKPKALAALDAAAEKTPDDKALARERGFLALETGQVQKAETLLKKAIDPKAPDWRVYSALGAALSAQGKQSQAQVQLAKALELAPDHPSVLNNLALTYALDGKHDDAEKMLRRVALSNKAEPQSKQNLALILGLKGKIDEARTVSEAALPAKTAEANVTYLARLKSSEPKLSRAEPKVDETPAPALASATPPSAIAPAAMPPVSSPTPAAPAKAAAVSNVPDYSTIPVTVLNANP